MSNFIEREADLSEGEESERSVTNDEPVAKKPKKMKEKKRRQISTDEEDEEDEAEDEDKAREEMKGFVVDDEEEEEGGEGNAGDDESSKAGSDGSDDLLEDDLELLNENTGQNVRGRVEISDDEDDRERIKGQLFGRTDYVEEGTTNGQAQYQRERDYEENESRSESEMSEDPFIVHDDGQRRRHRKKGKRQEYSDQVLDEAKDIFGVEDLEEFYEDEEVLDEELEEGEEGSRIARPRGAKVTLMDTIEPSELEKGFVRAEDKKIICEDRPERFQVRKIPVTEVDDHDLAMEAIWIHEYAFKAENLSGQSDTGLSIYKHGKEPQEVQLAEQEAPDKIREAIRFIRNQLFEVPFIAFYRKEYVESSLLMPDLWKVYQFDEKWCRLQMRKAKIVELLKRVQRYITESGLDEANDLRKVMDKDFKDVIDVQTNEELADVYAHFQLYYGSEMSRIQEWEKMTMKEQGEPDIVSRFKLSGRTDKYQLCIQCGLAPMADSFGLTAEEFAENYTEYVKHEVRQVQKEPNDIAKEYMTETFSTPEKVIQGAIFLLAQRFSREPAVRKKLRQIYRQNVLLSVFPSKKGRNEIDENHWLWGHHYIKDKPMVEIKEEEYLNYVKAKSDDLVEIDLHVETDSSGETNCLLLSLTQEPVFNREEFFYVAEEWNKLRKEVLRVCIMDIMIPVFRREVHEKLLEEARDCVIRKASLRLNQLIATEAFKPKFSYDGDDDDDMQDNGTRIMAVCYSADRAEASFAVVIDENGAVLDHVRLVHFLKRMNSRFPDEASLKKNDMKALSQLIQRRQPHLIVVNSENLEALRLAEDIRMVLKDPEFFDATFPIDLTVEVANSDAAKVYMNSRMATQEFVEFPPMLRQAVSLARFALDPLIEICHLCNAEDDILYMKFHPLQNEVSKQELLFSLQLECINRVNEVGVDINKCLEFPHTAGLLQFVCGLGPRKASHLLKVLKQNDNLLESRTKLVTFCRMGPKVFMNAAGFIKIDTAKIGERTDAYVEVLDGSRVHPETYEWARKMAIDALELDDTVDTSIALEEILKAPEKLKELDLDAFAEELTRQGFGNRSITLYDIRAELNYRYKDLRVEHEPPTQEEQVPMLLSEDPSKMIGKLCLGQVLQPVYRKPSEKETGLNARLNEHTNMWVCPFCKRGNFKEPHDVANHIQGNLECPGVCAGFKVKLDNGLMGFVRVSNLSDKADKISDPSKCFKAGQSQYFRIIEFKADRIECQLSCKSSDLTPDEIQTCDRYFDRDRFEGEKAADEKARKDMQQKKSLNSRVTSHPCFHNVTYGNAEKMLRKMDMGEAIIRPSGKSPNHLTVTWKVADDIYQHIQVEERDKQRAFEIGKKLLINGEEFEDLDEILARHIQPMTAYVRDIMSFKYFLAGVASESGAVIESSLRAQKSSQPQRIPYCVTGSKKYPGKFVLSYLLHNKVRNEYMSVTPEGIRFRKQMFAATEDCINWFKSNFAQRPV